MTVEVVQCDHVFKTKPFEHQLEAWNLSRDKTAFALLMEMGTGKSKVFIDTASYLFSRGKINGLVILASKSVTPAWVLDQLPEHLPDTIDRRVVLWGHETKKLRKELDALFTVEPLKLHVLVMNVDAVRTDRGYDFLERFLRSHDVLMGIDESTLIKNQDADVTKIILKMGKLARYRRIMTGTPVTESPLDAYAQFQFLEDGCLGSSSYYAFRNHFAVIRKRYIKDRSFNEIVGYQRLDELQSLINALSYRKLKAECLDLPDKVYEKRYIELTPEQTAYYRSLRDDALAWLNSGELVTAPLVITRLLRLRQALCNIAVTDEKETRKISEKDPRSDEVLAILREAGKRKAVIWTTFIPVVLSLTARINADAPGRQAAAYYGALSSPERQELVRRFQDPNDPLDTLVLQNRTGAFGTTLTQGDLAIYYDNDWSGEVRLQSEDRLHRIGQKNTVTYIDLVARDTTDETVLDALKTKYNLADQVTGDNLRRLLGG